MKMLLNFPEMNNYVDKTDRDGLKHTPPGSAMIKTKSRQELMFMSEVDFHVSKIFIFSNF